MKSGLAALALPLLVLGACSAERDAANDTTTLSVDGNAVEDAGNTVDTAVDEAGNVLDSAVDDVKNAAESGAPVINNVAREGAEVARDVGQAVENGADKAKDEIVQETSDNPPAKR
jgi:hypothetical protein